MMREEAKNVDSVIYVLDSRAPRSCLNDSFEEVERLADLIEGELAMVNFIAVNPIEESLFKRPEQAHMEDLITVLRKRRIVATIRDSAAQDIDGGCGQLRARRLTVPLSIGL